MALAGSRNFSVLPGFGPSLGYTLVYLSLIVLIPIAAVILKTLEMDWASFWSTVSSPRIVATYKLSFGAALLAAAINSVFGLVLAWALVRYSFPGIKIAFTPVGVLIALVFIGLPFIVRTVQPILEDIEIELEEAAASLGANRGQTFWYVVLPMLWPALLTGFALAFARGVGEYGSVIFIAGNIPMVSEITPLMIITKLEQYDVNGATAIAVVMLVFSFILLLIINALQAYTAKKTGRSF